MSKGDRPRLDGPLRRLTGPLIAVAFFCAIAPTLPWLEFGDPIENLNVATALEIRRTGHWLIPTLQGEPRLAKPPLTAWLTALSIRRATLAGLGSPDAAARAAAYRRLALECRVPALAATCAMLAVVYGLGRVLGRPGSDETIVRSPDVRNGPDTPSPSPHAGAERGAAERRPGSGGAVAAAPLPARSGAALRSQATFALPRREGAGDDPARLPPGSPDHAGHALGWVAAVVCGSTFLFLRQCRAATIDAQLALWVAVSNLFLAMAVFQGRRWLGCVGAGAALGLAVMSKGPVALVQSPLAFAAFLLWRRPAATPSSAARWFGPAALGALLAAVVGAGWFAWAASRFPGARSLWLAEVTRVGADGPPSTAPWYEYGLSLFLFLPWLPWLAAGAWLAARPSSKPVSPAPRPASLALALLLVPLVVMSFSRDRFRRYLTPLAPAGALLAAGAIVRHRRHGPATLAIAAVVLTGQAVWFHQLARRPSSRSTLRPVAERIRAEYPDAELYAYRPGGRNVISVPADDLSIHLNRTVGWAADSARIAPSDRPQVFVIYRTKRAGDPPPAIPTGWLLLARPPAAGNEDRYVFVRPPLRRTAE